MKHTVYLFLLLMFIFFVGCKESVQTPNTTTKKSDITIVVKHKTHSKLNNASLKMIADWKEYKTMDELIIRYENISPEEALGNSSELEETVRFLKDSLNVKPLKTSAFRSRLNVLENEILRLSDMADIPAITATEVNEQVDKMLLIFGSVNDKINTVHSQEQFNKEINLDDFFTLERDSITKLNEKKIPKKPKKKSKIKAKQNSQKKKT